jgi:hypothetical protein
VPLPEARITDAQNVPAPSTSSRSQAKPICRTAQRLQAALTELLDPDVAMP